MEKGRGSIKKRSETAVCMFLLRGYVLQAQGDTETEDEEVQIGEEVQVDEEVIWYGY